MSKQKTITLLKKITLGVLLIIATFIIGFNASYQGTKAYTHYRVAQAEADSKRSPLKTQLQGNHTQHSNHAVTR